MKISSFVILVGALIATPWSRADDPDLSFESQLHDIYLNFNNRKLDENEWRELVGKKANEIYKIQNGDNLWNISKVFFGDGNYWPKIWSLNREIVNPHLIEPGNSIRFILGDESDAPSFTITENSEDEPKPSRRPVIPVDVEIPPQSVEYKPVLRKLPPSLLTTTNSVSKYNKAGISFERLQRATKIDRNVLSSSIVQNLPPSVAQIVEVEGGGLTAAQAQYIYVEAGKGQLQSGQKYLVVKDKGQLDRQNLKLERVGGERIVEYQGEVTIAEKLESVKRASPKEIFRALVDKAVTPTTVGSSLTPGQFRTFTVSGDGPRSSLVAQIIGGSGLSDSLFYAQRSIVYLNRGEQDGVGVGQILPIRANPALRNTNTTIRETVTPIGYLKIIDVQKAFSTAVVIDQFQEIRTGDVTGQGPLHPVISDNRTTTHQAL